MNYTISHIPTEYNGRQYRSRLEAKWAAFFDLCEWKYEYEPIDLNGWFPDFALFDDDGNMILVEVKPVTIFPEEVAKRIENAAKSTRCELLILGQGPFLDDWEYGHIGWLMEVFHINGDEVNNGWGDAVWGQWKSTNKPGFCHANSDYTDRISNTYDGGCFGAGTPKNLEQIWAKAGNLVQYRPPIR